MKIKLDSFGRKLINLCELFMCIYSYLHFFIMFVSISLFQKLFEISVYYGEKLELTQRNFRQAGSYKSTASSTRKIE